MLEALRRFQWTFFRVEVAYLKRFGSGAHGDGGEAERATELLSGKRGRGLDSPLSPVAVVAADAAAAAGGRFPGDFVQMRRGSWREDPPVSSAAANPAAAVAGDAWPAGQGAPAAASAAPAAALLHHHAANHRT